MEETLISSKTLELVKEKGFPIDEMIYRDTKNGLPVGNWKERLKYFETEEKSDLTKKPTQSLLQKWLREKHDIHIGINTQYNKNICNELKPKFSYEISNKGNLYHGYGDNLDVWIGISRKLEMDIFYHITDTYEEALEFALQEALNLI